MKATAIFERVEQLAVEDCASYEMLRQSREESSFVQPD